ncbi:hypothetical protein AAMO2058_000306000 [Amorphochlora amoebiformis]
MDFEEMMTLMRLEHAPEPSPSPRELKAEPLPAKSTSEPERHPELNIECLQNLFLMLPRTELERVAGVCSGWAKCVSLELKRRSRVLKRQSIAAKRSEENKLRAELRLRAFYEARQEAIKANKDRNRKCQDDRTMIQNSQNTLPGDFAAVSRTTSMIPPAILKNAPPERMRMLVAALASAKSRRGSTTNTSRDIKEVESPVPVGVGGSAAEKGERLLGKLIGAAVRDESFLEAHKLKKLRDELRSLRDAVRQAAEKENFLEAHAAKKTLANFLEDLQEKALACGGPDSS